MKVVSTQTGVVHNLSRGVCSYMSTHPAPVVGVRREFLRYMMRIARNSKGMSDIDYLAMEEELLDDVINIYHANKNRNQRNKTKPKKAYTGGQRCR